MTDRITIPLRLAPDLHARLKKLAQVDQRSLNAFITLALSRLAAETVTVVAKRALNAYESGAKARQMRPRDHCSCGSGMYYKNCHGKKR